MSVNDVRPFRGLTYDPLQVGSVADCLAQPYDVISPQERERYLQRHPCNIVHLTLGSPLPSDTESDNVYSRSRAQLDQWTACGVLRQAPEDSLWLYEQRFALDGAERGCRGVLAAVRLQDFAERRILPHEKVMSQPVEDRMRLTLATEAQLEPIWGFYRQPDADLAPLAVGPTDLDCTDAVTGVRHRVWRLSDRRRCAAICAAIGRGEIFIADGHHRYQTMLNVRAEMRRRRPDAGPDAPWEFILLFLVNAAREPLTILPYHRLARSVPPDGSLLERLARSFDIERAEDWRARLAAAGRGGQAFALALAGDRQRYVLRRRESDGRLDVDMLNDLVLREGLGLTEEDLRLGRGIDYTHSPESALARLEAGEAAAAFFLNPTRLDQIEGCAREGGIMPRKSSFFYPKPLSGIVLYPMRPVPGPAAGAGAR